MFEREVAKRAKKRRQEHRGSKISREPGEERKLIKQEEKEAPENTALDSGLCASSADSGGPAFWLCFLC
jgi:hypothetical protein